MNDASFKERLIAVFSHCGLEAWIDEEKAEKYLALYKRLIEQNKLYNLTAITEETRITLRHFDRLDDMYAGFRDVFQDAQEDNPRIQIIVE